MQKFAIDFIKFVSIKGYHYLQNTFRIFAAIHWNIWGNSAKQSEVIRMRMR